MKIILIRPPFIEIQTGAPIGLAFMQNVLKEKHSVKMIDFSFDVSAKVKFTCGQFTRNFTLKKSHPAYAYAYRQLNHYCKVVADLEPDIVGFHLAYSTTDFALAMAKKLHGMGIKMVAGGPDATYKADELYTTGLFQSIVKGYGEEAIEPALYNSGIFEMPLSRNKNYVPDYTGIEFKKYGGKIPILTTRGCPHSCTFCSQHLRYYYHDIDSVTKQIAATPPKCGIMLNDSNLNANPKRTKALFSAISKVIGRRYIHAFGFEVSSKFNMYANEFARCNFSEARIGIESGSLKVRKAMNKPNFTNKDVREMIKKMTAAGTTVWAQFIFCYPDETNQDREETLALMHAIANENPKGKVKIYWFRFVVHHGTEDFFKEKYGVVCTTIRDWHNKDYNPKRIAHIAKRLKPRLPAGANIYL
jgi:radical SAM superfamily enzyme YgiQ (UPF0313 family)